MVTAKEADELNENVWHRTPQPEDNDELNEKYSGSSFGKPRERAPRKRLHGHTTGTDQSVQQSHSADSWESGSGFGRPASPKEAERAGHGPQEYSGQDEAELNRKVKPWS
jgi:hypothetical protein